MEMPLAGVNELAQRSSRGTSMTGQQFSLLFQGPAPAFRQETYAVEHGSLGHFSLFLVPVGKPEGHVQTYQAIVNNVAV